MVQLLNLIAHNLAAPALHNSGFAVSIVLVSNQWVTIFFKITTFDMFWFSMAMFTIIICAL
jgi:hypothetical protein